MPALSEVVADEIDRWGLPEIERLLFGTADPQVIADAVSDFCQRNLGGAVDEGLFYRGSVGSVFGVVLDGRSAVLKVYQPRWAVGFLAAVQTVQRRLASAGFPCPRPILAPTPLAFGSEVLVTVESLLPDPGLRPLGGDSDRRASATALAEQIVLASDIDTPALDGHPLRDARAGLYPEPHSPLFDFAVTASGAEWIDRFASRARLVLDRYSGPRVAAHMDWSARNVRVHSLGGCRLRLGQCRSGTRAGRGRPGGCDLVCDQ